jgi:hypothetical protein
MAGIGMAVRIAVNPRSRTATESVRIREIRFIVTEGYSKPTSVVQQILSTEKRVLHYAPGYPNEFYSIVHCCHRYLYLVLVLAANHFSALSG